MTFFCWRAVLLFTVALGFGGCVADADRRNALIDGLLNLAATDAPVEEARIRAHFTSQRIAEIQRLRVADTVIAGGLTQQDLEIAFSGQDCVTPAMIRE